MEPCTVLDSAPNDERHGGHHPALLRGDGHRHRLAAHARAVQLIFGGVIAATDPVAATALFREVVLGAVGLLLRRTTERLPRRLGVADSAEPAHAAAA